MSRLSPDELDALLKSDLDKDAPFAIQDVSQGFVSVSRHAQVTKGTK